MLYTKAMISTITEKRRIAVIPTFAVRMIVVSGILQWTYLAQVLIEDGGAGQ